MKKSFTISIPKPCAEKWGNFTSTNHGGFCNSCSKEVIDFSEMDETQMLNFFTNKKTNTCGRFRADQLKSYVLSPEPKVNTGFYLFKAGLLCFMMFLISKPSTAQNKTSYNQSDSKKVEHVMGKASEMLKEFVVAGTVTDSEDGSALPGVNIYLKNAMVGTASDLEGKFEFPQKLKAGDVLVFSFIGMQTQEYVVPSQPLNSLDVRLDIKMEMACEIFMGEVAVTEVYTEPKAFQRFWKRVKSVF